MFSCEISKIFKNTYFEEHPRTTADQMICNKNKSVSHLKSETIFGNWKPFKNNEKCLLFHLKIAFFPRYLNFCLDFLVMKKNGLIKKIRLVSKFMTSQHGNRLLQYTYFKINLSILFEPFFLHDQKGTPKSQELNILEHLR